MIKLTKHISYALAVVAALALGLMMLHVTADVIGKYLFNSPIPGTAEVVASYYMVAAVFLPLAWVEINEGSIVVEILYDLFPSMTKKLLFIVSTTLSSLFYGGLAWLSLGPAIHAWKIGEVVEGTWRVVIWPTKFILPLGLALACLIMLIRLIEISRGNYQPVEDSETKG
ncbi:TRAP transporter small permease subunit [Halomonas sp. HAL1]|uniref:TRAP transporter small permease subunit n=1 Tax=Halomonas sp. HAL1 TaxID=550984 RepID=UPI00022D31C9|nr:TRAP transporter small permease [Halomonas sp. HAL1]EHA16476.1 TRAP dicarboxylate family transporter DctQ subunit [Halomonas sp. HAL1]WKV92694.1 TRAP transporter small permease [Halomonas sp. HAL1]